MEETGRKRRKKMVARAGSVGGRHRALGDHANTPGIRKTVHSAMFSFFRFSPSEGQLHVIKLFSKHIEWGWQDDFHHNGNGGCRFTGFPAPGNPLMPTAITIHEMKCSRFNTGLRSVARSSTNSSIDPHDTQPPGESQRRSFA